MWILVQREHNVAPLCAAEIYHTFSVKAGEISPRRPLDFTHTHTHTHTQRHTLTLRLPDIETETIQATHADLQTNSVCYMWKWNLI